MVQELDIYYLKDYYLFNTIFITKMQIQKITTKKFYIKKFRPKKVKLANNKIFVLLYFDKAVKPHYKKKKILEKKIKLNKFFSSY